MNLLLSVPLLSSSFSHCCVVFILLLVWIFRSCILRIDMWSHRTRQPFFSGTCGFSQRPSLLFPLSFSGLQICSAAWESVCQTNKHMQCYRNNKPEIDTILLLGDEEGTRIRKSSVYFIFNMSFVSVSLVFFFISHE